MTVDKWEQRMLCPDGACVGVISMNGTCRVCGKAVPDWGDPRKPGRVSSKAEADELEHEPEPEDDEDVDDEKQPPTNGKAVAEAAPEPNEDDITKRKLCADGACVGVIGADGTCKVCRKAADGSKSEPDDEYEDEDDDEYEDDDAEYEDDDADAVKADADSGKADGDQGVKKADGAKADAKKADDDDNRALCSDGACVGVIGDDAKCKVCGKAAG